MAISKTDRRDDKRRKLFGERIRQLREENRLSQTALAKQLGITQNALWRYENASAFPPMEIFIGFADIFDVSLDWLFGRTDSRQGKTYSGVSKTSQEQLNDFTEKLLAPGSPYGDKLREMIGELVHKEMGKDGK